MSLWNQPYINRVSHAPFSQIESLFKLAHLSNWPNAAGLNELRASGELPSSCTGANVPEFICQDSMAQTDDYYEQYIHRNEQIPTRPDNWHDLFNGLIWMMFPQTKRLLNQLHVEDISANGLSPRSTLRNHITHFDECGVVLACETDEIPALLSEHRWQEAFVERRELWHKQVHVFTFGHANLEMLLDPFEGLTGKWLAVKVNEKFASASIISKIAHLDAVLSESLHNERVFEQRKPLRPIPLLGIPGWWEPNLDFAFYQNQNYFRPAPAKKRYPDYCFINQAK